MKRSERHLREARDLEARLRAEGRGPDADRIAAICRSLSAMRETCSRLYADNMALRQADEPGQARTLNGQPGAGPSVPAATTQQEV